MWTPESVILRRRFSITSWTREGLLCRLYLTLSLGALPPLFLLLSLMLCQGTLRCILHLFCLSAVTWSIPSLFGFVLPSTITYIVQKTEELCWGANSPPILRDSCESACLGCMHCDRSVAYVLKSCCTSTPLIQCLCTQSYASA